VEAVVREAGQPAFLLSAGVSLLELGLEAEAEALASDGRPVVVADPLEDRVLEQAVGAVEAEVGDVVGPLLGSLVLPLKHAVPVVEDIAQGHDPPRAGDRVAAEALRPGGAGEVVHVPQGVADALVAVLVLEGVVVDVGGGEERYVALGDRWRFLRLLRANAADA